MNLYHITWMTGKLTDEGVELSTGKTFAAPDMISALIDFQASNPNIDPLYIVSQTGASAPYAVDMAKEDVTSVIVNARHVIISESLRDAAELASSVTQADIKRVLEKSVLLASRYGIPNKVPPPATACAKKGPHTFAIKYGTLVCTECGILSEKVCTHPTWSRCSPSGFKQCLICDWVEPCS